MISFQLIRQENNKYQLKYPYMPKSNMLKLPQ